MPAALDPSFYRIAGPDPDARPAGPGSEPPAATAIRVEIQARHGMQKEAVVSQLEPPARAWRLVSDEGPYLNGTDLAPFPLAFFTAGQQFCLMAQIVRLAAARGVTLGRLGLGHENRYTMTGSILRGDMTGGALPAETLVAVASDASPVAIAALVRDAAAASPGQAVMRDPLANGFSITYNGRDVPVQGVGQSGARARDPRASFTAIAPAEASASRRAIMTKTETAAERHGVAGGAGSSLQAEQNRTLHVRGDARLTNGTVLETAIRLFKPLGSSFRLLGDLPVSQGGSNAAPPPLAYLAAGVGFCFMTQLGRYAHIKKQTFDGVRICQDTTFRQTPAGAAVDPVQTHVFLEGDEPADHATTLVRMGEQTCFLHAAMRGTHPSVIRAELNGTPLPLEG